MSGAEAFTNSGHEKIAPPLAVIAPLRETSIVLVALWGVLRLGERDGAGLKLVGAVATAGATAGSASLAAMTGVAALGRLEAWTSFGTSPSSEAESSK